MKLFNSRISSKWISRKLKNIFNHQLRYALFIPPISHIGAYEPYLKSPPGLAGDKRYKSCIYKIEEAIATHGLPENSFVMKIKNQNIAYYSEKPSENVIRQQVMRRFFYYMHLKFPAPDGVYVVNYNDSFNSRLRYPLLCYASKQALVASEAVYLIPDFESMSFYKEIFHRVALNERLKTWEEKKSTLFWRGATTGGLYPKNNWDDSPRVQFINAVRTLENETTTPREIFDVGFSSYVQFLDDENLAKFKYHYPLKEFVSIQNSLHYKYLIDIDGNSCTYSRMAWILYSNSLLFKHHSDNIQWYYSLLKENVHYLPVKKDFSNLLEQYLWAEKNPAQAKAMAKNSNKLARKVFNPLQIYKFTSNTMKAYQHKLMTNI